MAGERRYTRIPPESTGDRVYMIHTAEIAFNNKNTINPSHVWQVGERYDIAGFTGTNVHVHGVYDKGDGTGILAVHYNKTAKFENSDPTIGNKISYGGVDVADVADFYDVYIPTNNIMGYDNPEYGWDIDRFGSGKVTFDDGPPEVTAFGKLRVNEPRPLAIYDFSHGKLEDQFVNSREGVGVDVTWIENDGVVELSTTATNGDRVTHTSNLFHASSVGSGTLAIMGTRLGDTGKEFVIRNWGLFDANDGFFFQQNGTTLNIVHRTSVQGAINNYAISQANWNKDTLDGTGGADNPSGMNLDVSKSNIYWIDYQHIGGGRVRYGVYYQGQRILCHEMNMENGAGNTDNTNALRYASRPMCWAQANRNGTPASPSTMYALGGGVYLEMNADPLNTAQQYSFQSARKVYQSPHTVGYWKTKQSDGDAPTTAAVDSGYSGQTSTQYMFTLSPKQFYGAAGGRENHTVYQPLQFNFHSFDKTTGQDRPVEVRVFSKCLMRGVNWQNAGTKAPTLQYDTMGDHIAHGPEIARFVVNGEYTYNFEAGDDAYQYNTVRNLSDQQFSRALQSITNFESASDQYSTGVSRVQVTVGTHPIFGNNIHFFEDKQPVLLRNADGGEDFGSVFTGTNTIKAAGDPGGYASSDYVTAGNESNWYYLSITGNQTGWLYTSTANIDDDRTVRVLTLSAVGTTAVGDTLSVTSGAASGATATVIHIDGNDVYVVGRSSSTLDVGVTSGSVDTTTGGAAVGTISSITTSTTVRDYWTSLLAIDQAGLGFDQAHSLTSPDLALFSTNPPRQAWTFMARNITDTVADSDGDAGPALNNAELRTNITWKERNL